MKRCAVHIKCACREYSIVVTKLSLAAISCVPLLFVHCNILWCRYAANRSIACAHVAALNGGGDEVGWPCTVCRYSETDGAPTTSLVGDMSTKYNRPCVSVNARGHGVCTRHGLTVVSPAKRAAQPS
jgi:hypothetical protein